ncbi:DUF4097 family beta strand repeat-containing protein [Gluconobacter roseus]|uniref:DUF4097 domain-containing protein n=1 Tax=Gluconobacter roseus NBRC 3990 TaxID=1307950 RepID=A0A4Y3M6T0_9PROT|nr:DUF4097 family beta strand repeat-containing protein [Gluconobacter roseus]KXV42826.1 hypothetical protein AD943_12265 [Gluconobacter roseus]GBR48969.1 hypothetical protein AA3990_2336 [Gluconobacter roseus NBRC 3990]GEB04295.1 hypothetical protein GRO01_18710 [Gluconobacter roseus NBRC 3990]GLP92738.1 hypothetical protein GCM10007871_07160 [Gluconobacter roseus NBRC 3990]
MTRFTLSLPVLALGTALAFPVCAAPLSQSSISDDISQSTLPEGGKFSTVSGDVTVGTSDGPLSVRTVSGDIHVTQSHGLLDVHTVSGTLDVDHAAGAVEVRSASGNVTLDHADGAVSIRTMSGESTLDHAGRDIMIRSISGDMTLMLDAASQMRTIDIGTVSGDMTVHLPHGFGGTFDIRLKQRRADKALPLEQSLGLTVQTGNWEKESAGSEEVRTVTASGRVGDGRDHVVIRSVVGTLKLVQD